LETYTHRVYNDCNIVICYMDSMGTISDMKIIRHSKLPITIESSDRLDYEMLHAIQLNLMYDEKDSREDNQGCWNAWVDEDGNWFNPYKPNKNQMELFNEE